MRFEITGNFQYDLGILGLKKVLDFFGIEYKSDGKFYIEVDRTKEQLLEDITAKLIIDKGVNHIWNKLKEDKELKNEIGDLDISLNKEKITYLPYKGLKNVIENIYSIIESHIPGNFKNRETLLEKIRNKIWQKGISLFDSILLNFHPDKKAVGEDSFNKALDKLNKNIIKGAKCSFCNKKDGKIITRDVFFFAPASLNGFWFNKVNFYICPDCLVLNFAITQTFTFLGNNMDALVFYTPNLEQMEKMNSIIQNSMQNKINDNKNFYMGQIIKPIIEYEKQKIKYQSFYDGFQILFFKLNNQRPELEIFVLDDHSIEKMISIEKELDSLFNNDDKTDSSKINKLLPEIKTKNGYVRIDLSKKLLEFISHNQKIFYLVQNYARHCIISVMLSEEKNPAVKNFSPWTFLKFLEIHYKLEGKDMNEFEKFKDLGRKIRQGVWASLSKPNKENISKNDEESKKNNNTFKNKIIALSNSFLNSSKGSFQQFQELLCRTIILYDLNVDTSIMDLVTENNYGEIATTIALAMLLSVPKEKNEQTNEDKSDTQELEKID